MGNEINKIPSSIRSSNLFTHQLQVRKYSADFLRHAKPSILVIKKNASVALMTSNCKAHQANTAF